MSASLPQATDRDLERLRVEVARRAEGEPAWHAAARRGALEQYALLPLLDRPRTPLRTRRLDRINVAEPGAADPVPAGLVRNDEAAGHATLSNGEMVSLALDPVVAAEGVRLLPLRRALAEAAEPVAAALGTVQPDDEDRYAALNRALWRDGVFLYVPPGVRVARPVTVLHWVGPSAGGVFPRVLVVAGTGAQVVLVEAFLGDAADRVRHLVSAVTEVVAQDGAEVTVAAVQELPPATEAFIRRRGHAARDARVDWITGELGAALAVSGHHTTLAAPGARSESVTVFFPSGGQHHDYTAAVEHVGPHTTSSILARGVLKDRARSIFTGRSRIRKGAVRADARQREQTLMLSETARADAIPSLEIEDNDVFAAHAASAGPVDAAALYYLESRGIPPDEAVRLVVRGFLEPVMAHVRPEAVRAALWRAVEAKLAP
ncbi:MAG: Fe-S cluster assembly protein SufD [Actinomycetia bacterium]|nr:Fe-S cluster assembly protein SufD [Actinomycetes bacterium]